MNVTSGTVAIYAAFHGHLYLAAWLVILAMVFDFFDGFIQAYIFVFLTSMFMKETME